jgi:hypothetical protein
VSDKKLAKLRSLIENHPDEFEAFLERVSDKEFRWILNHVHRLPRSVKRSCARPESDAKRADNRKQAKNRYDYRRRQYRDRLIQEQFGTRTNVACLSLIYRWAAIDRAWTNYSMEKRCP